MKTRTALVLLAAASASAFAAPSDFKTDIARHSYAVGMDIGSGLKRSDLGLDVEELMRGLKDTMGSGKAALTDEEMESAINEFRTSMQAKMKERLEKQSAENAAKGKKFLEENKAKDGVKVTASGLQYKIVKEGGDKPKASDAVTVHYRGKLIDGTEFDSSYKRNEPTSFPLEGVIPGWTEGLQLVGKGGKAELYIPAELAYGKNAPPAIGPDQVLVFEVELIDIGAPAAPGGIGGGSGSTPEGASGGMK
jgi:FKBP-type peptidyl-prolyl cis-trans isomerase